MPESISFFLVNRIDNWKLFLILFHPVCKSFCCHQQINICFFNQCLYLVLSIFTWKWNHNSTNLADCIEHSTELNTIMKKHSYMLSSLKPFFFQPLCKIIYHPDERSIGVGSIPVVRKSNLIWKFLRCLLKNLIIIIFHI